MPAWGTALCLADLDGDGKQWPVVGSAAWLVHTVTPDWDFRWTFETTVHSVTGLAAGDLNCDGWEEIAASTVYFCVPAITTDGKRLWQDEDYNDYWFAGPNFTQLAVGDVDGDGLIEVIVAASDTLVHCISNTGEKKWTRRLARDSAWGSRVARRCGWTSTGSVSAWWNCQPRLRISSSSARAARLSPPPTAASYCSAIERRYSARRDESTTAVQARANPD